MLTHVPCRAVALALVVASLPVFWAGPARAQGGCGQQTRSGPGGILSPGLLGQQSTTGSSNAVQQQLALQVVLQQLRQQQLAMMLAQQQPPQNAMMVAQQQPPAQNVMQVTQPQQNAQTARPRPAPVPEGGDGVTQPENPEEAAARQLKIARELLADARTARLDGEGDRAARMRARAGERLRNLVATYPGTRAADAAQDLLETTLAAAK
jgi:hypothetical protein